MSSGIDGGRIASLERHVELLAAMLGTTRTDLDCAWPDHLALRVQREKEAVKQAEASVQ